jgi:hypothetical protein
VLPDEQRKLIIVEFFGGDRDGLVYRSDSDDPHDVEECMGYYIPFSQGGKIGSGIRTYSAAGIQKRQELWEQTPDGPKLKRPPVFSRDHVYRVTDHFEDSEKIVVRYTYKGRETSAADREGRRPWTPSRSGKPSRIRWMSIDGRACPVHRKRVSSSRNCFFAARGNMRLVLLMSPIHSPGKSHWQVFEELREKAVQGAAEQARISGGGVG